MPTCETNVMTRPGATAQPAAETCRWTTYRPAVDITELPGEFTLALDMPGCTPESIEVNATGNELTITGAVKRRLTKDDDGLLLREYGVGDFARSFRVGPGIDLTNVKAHYRHGVLTLTLPKAAEARARRIQVNQN